jgi:hypothetical protein
MSLEVLKAGNTQEIRQMPKHDLESIFYVLLYFCTMFVGPGDQEREQNSMTATIPLARWLIPDMELDLLFKRKFADVSFFDENVVPHIHPYFLDLKECLQELYDVMFPPTAGHSRPLRQLEACMADHQQVIEVLQRTLDRLPDDEPPSGPAPAPSAPAPSKPGPLSTEPGLSEHVIISAPMKRTVSDRDTSNSNLEMLKSSPATTPSPKAMKPLPMRTQSVAASIKSNQRASDSGFFSMDSGDSDAGPSKRIRSGSS